MLLVPSLFLTFGITTSDPAALQVDFATQIKPILEARCYECHGEKKQKGRLRLDQRGSVFEPPKGKKPRVVPGKPEESSIYKLCALPKDDPDVMPADGEPLTAEQLALIKTWIEEGATWPADAATPSPEPKAANALAPDPDDFGMPAGAETDSNAQDPRLAKIAERGALALRIAANTRALEANFSLLGSASTDADLALLSGIQSDLVWLNLSRTAITDDGLKTLASATELRRLNLSNTKITDQGIAALAALPKLEYLNLYGTAVTDAGLASLRGLARLRSVFVWQTAVTEAGAKALADAIPGVVVDRGVYEPAKSEPVPDATANSAPAPINAKCPVSGAAVDASQSVTVDDQVIAFCCANCKGQFEKDPQPLLAKVAEFKPKTVANAAPAPADDGLWTGKLADLDGKDVELANYRGKVVLVVNTASQGRYAAQYRALQSLEAKYRDRGFAVLAFPSNDFGAQEPGDAKAISDFARKQFGAQFTIFAKSSVTGAANSTTSALFTKLSAAAGKAPSWNFTKYLVTKDGKSVTRFEPRVAPDAAEIVAAIESALGAN